jgi:hypothetical protein
MPPLETSNPPLEPWHSFFKELATIASDRFIAGELSHAQYHAAMKALADRIARPDH